MYLSPEEDDTDALTLFSDNQVNANNKQTSRFNKEFIQSRQQAVPSLYCDIDSLNITLEPEEFDEGAIKN